MKRLIPLVILLAACTSTAGETTTVPLAEPSTTSTKARSTTTTTEPSNTTEAECTERDGVLRSRRGLVCPPHLVGSTVIRNEEGQQVYLPGTYRTRQFATPLQFGRTETFSSIGEMELWVLLDLEGQGRRYVEAWAGDLARQIASLPDRACGGLEPDEWLADVSTENITIGGVEGTHTEFGNRFDEGCLFVIDGLPSGWETYEGWRVAIDVLLAAGSPVTFVSTAPERAFDAYWNDVAQPILDSIEFLDP